MSAKALTVVVSESDEDDWGLVATSSSADNKEARDEVNDIDWQPEIDSDGNDLEQRNCLPRCKVAHL